LSMVKNSAISVKRGYGVVVVVKINRWAARDRSTKNVDVDSSGSCRCAHHC
jgi:hypothetical protein